MITFSFKKTTSAGRKVPFHGFITKGAERRARVLTCSSEAAAGNEPALRGFTLVETLIAIVILTLALTGPFYAVQKGLDASYISRDQLIAGALAQEGIEYVRGVRDGNYLYNAHHPSSRHSWLYGLDGTAADGSASGGTSCLAAAGLCTVDESTFAASPCNGTCARLALSATDIYNQQAYSATNIQTGFTRTLQLVPVTASEVKVVVTVTWTSHQKTYTVTANDYLSNWL